MIELHPQIIRRDGQEAFVVLTWEEFVELRDQLDDLLDVVELRQAKRENEGKPTATLDEVAQAMGIDLS